MRSWILSGVNCFALIGVLIVNGLASYLPLNGQNTGEISDRFDVLFKPAGYVFSIWGIIYLGLILFVIAQFLPSVRKTDLTSHISIWFLISCLANAGWLFLWHYNRFAWTVPVMLVLLLSLIFIYLRIDMISTPATAKWFIRVPFSIYLAWISVATIANVSIALKAAGWSGWGFPDTGWLILMLSAALVLSFLMVYTKKDIAYALVILWAFIGIGIQNQDLVLIPTIAWIASGMAVVMPLTGLALRGLKK